MEGLIQPFWPCALTQDAQYSLSNQTGDFFPTTFAWGKDGRAPPVLFNLVLEKIDLNSPLQLYQFFEDSYATFAF